MNRSVYGYLLVSVSGMLLGSGFVFAGLFWVPWCALAPLIWQLNRSDNSWQQYVMGLLFGLGFVIVAGHWITPFVHLLKGLGAVPSFFVGCVFWFYSAQLFALASLACGWLRWRGGLPGLLIYPLVFGVFIHEFPMLFSPYLGGTQIAFPLALQATDLLGEQALAAVMVLCNTVLAQSVSWPQPPLQRGRYVVAGLILVAWFGYGFYALSLWQQRMPTWPSVRVGLVQPNELPDRRYLPPPSGYSRTYPAALALTDSLVDQGAQWVLWPEARYKGYLDQAAIRRAFQQHVRRLSVPLLFQDMRQHTSGPIAAMQNGAVLLDQQGAEVGVHYKMLRVAFGEYLPLVDQLPVLEPIWSAFFGGFTDRIMPGQEAGFFDLGFANVAPLICFEVMFGEEVAKRLQHRPTNTILAVLSSNGWFGRSREPFQHLYGGALRAVENRLPMVHIMNNGPSAVIAPTGEILSLTPAQQAGGYLVNIPHSSAAGNTVYTRYPWLFSSICRWSLLLCALWAWCSPLLGAADQIRWINSSRGKR